MNNLHLAGSNRTDSRRVSTVSGKRVEKQSSEAPKAICKKAQTECSSEAGFKKKRAVAVPTQFKKIRGTLGLLQMLLTHIPVEIVLFEILCYLDPRDLLHLSRTSKDLRSILMSKTTESTWRISRLNVDGLPPLPSDLNEPQYARLMFDSYCHVCNKPWHCDNILWRFRIRCCRTCQKTFPLYNWSYLYNMYRPFTFFDILPKEKVKGKSKGQLDVIYSSSVALRLKVEFVALQSEEERQTWLDRKRKERRDLEQHVRLCETWSKNKLDHRIRELIDIREQRLQSILDRLEAIDLRDEAELILRGKSDFTTAPEFYNHRFVNQPKKLTDRVWDNIEPDLVDLLSEHQTKRLKRERIQNCQERYAHLKQEYHDIMSRQDLREPYPSIGDILTDPIFEEIICNSATDEAVTPEILRVMLIEELPRIIDKWRPEKLRTLLRVVQKARPNATNSDFHLATTVFGCAICDSLLIYPQMFYHQCCFMNRAGDRAEDLDEFFETVEQGPWSARPIFFHLQSSRLAEKIVIGAGLDSSISTTRDLTLARPVIEFSGRDVFPLRNFMTWPAALSHNLTVQDEVLFTINCSGPETSKIRAKEPLSHFPDICCAHCHEETIPRKLLHHLTHVHNLEASSTSSSTVSNFYRQFRNHWYWNPRANLNMIGTEFCC